MYVDYCFTDLSLNLNFLTFSVIKHKKLSLVCTENDEQKILDIITDFAESTSTSFLILFDDGKNSVDN